MTRRRTRAPRRRSAAVEMAISVNTSPLASDCKDQTVPLPSVDDDDDLGRRARCRTGVSRALLHGRPAKPAFSSATRAGYRAPSNTKPRSSPSIASRPLLVRPFIHLPSPPRLAGPLPKSAKSRSPQGAGRQLENALSGVSSREIRLAAAASLGRQLASGTRQGNRPAQ